MKGGAGAGCDWLVRALGWTIHPIDRERIVGDLLEELVAEVRPRWGRVAGYGWLATLLLRSAMGSRWQRRAGADACPKGGSMAPEGGTTTMLDGPLQDLRYALRSYGRDPAFTAVTILTLATGIGATLAISAVLNGVLLRPLPYPDADRLVHIEGSPGGLHALAMPNLRALDRDARTLESVAIWQGWTLVLASDDGRLERRAGASVSADYFTLLQTTPALGRLFAPGDAVDGHAPVVVASHAAWLRDLGGDPDVVGRVVESGGVRYTVVGVAPPDFRDPIAGAMGWVAPSYWRASPPEFEQARDDRGWIGFWGLARLAPGRSPAEATADAATVLRETFPDLEADPDVAVATVREKLARDVRPTLYVLLAAVLVILAIGCGNVANLMLSRATVRSREMAVRASLGAGRSRLVRQLFTESLLLAAIASALGLAGAMVTARVMAALPGADLPDTTAIVLDFRVALAAALLALLTSFLFGFLPALRATGQRVGLASSLRERGRGGDGRGRLATRKILLVAETGLALVLLVAAGLLIRTFVALRSVDPGFGVAGTVAVQVGLPEERFVDLSDQNATLDALIEEARSLPGVASAGGITDLPMSGAVNSTLIRRSDDGPTDPELGVQTLVRAVAGDWFGAMGVPVLQGRGFDGSEAAGTEPVALVNRTFSRRMFGDSTAVLGASVTVRGTPRRIVGIVADVTEFSLADEASPVLYEPYGQNVQAWMRSGVALVARTAPDVEAWTANRVQGLRSRLLDADPRVTVGSPTALADLIARDVATPRFRAFLIGLFGTVALFLTAVGIGGVMAYTVSQRLPEMGLRMALGARAEDVVGLVVGESVRLAGLGLAVGVVIALGSVRLLRGFLWAVPAVDPAVFIGAAGLLGAVALAASWVPAKRAARADPAASLRGG